MSDLLPIQNDFISQLTIIIEKNISNEQFGVSELADQMNMSRSNLLRRVKKETKLSVSQLISQVRLKRGMDLLRKSSLNVSEVSHQVGFSSTSYFIKCFREFYGYPPGEVGKRAAATNLPAPTENTFNSPVADVNESRASDFSPATASKRNFYIIGSVVVMVLLSAGLLYSIFPNAGIPSLEKSIAVLPFKNDSNDSSNIYLINGLMEATLTNLQKIKDLKVISRTTVEKYRNTSKSIPEIARELGVSYFVEGSGQKIGDKILLNIQLIEASSDKHLWANQYRKDTKDIFELQQEIAKNIASEIQVIITPEEEKRIEKNPTNDPVAYDFFLKGRELFYRSGRGDLEASIPYLKKAIELDEEFALAYATAVMVYYYLDIFQVEKKYGSDIDNYADKAMALDPKLAESLIAKAISFAYKREYELAVPYFEKALEFSPNNGLVIHFLTEFYAIHVPNTRKYLEYALIGTKLDFALQDSATASFKHFHLANALLQTGFIDEALKYINKSLAYNPNNYFGYLKAYILLAKNNDLKQARQLLTRELNKDTTRIDIIQEVAKVCFYMRDYESAYQYYKRFIVLRETQQLDLFKSEDLKIARVLDLQGQKEKAKTFVKSFKRYADEDKTIYKHLNLVSYYAYTGDTQKAIEHLKLFSKEDNFVYWVLLLRLEPELDPVRNMPEFGKIMQDIEAQFWNDHEEIKVTLQQKELL